MSLQVYKDDFDFYAKNIQYIFAETETDYIILKKRGTEYYMEEKKFSKSEYKIKRAWEFHDDDLSKDHFIILLSQDEKDRLISYTPKQEDYSSYEMIDDIIEKTERIQEIAPMVFFAEDKKEIVSISKEGEINRMDFKVLLGSCSEMLQSISVYDISKHKFGINLDLGIEYELSLILDQENDKSKLSSEIITAGITDELLVTNLSLPHNYNFQDFVIGFQDSKVYSHIAETYQKNQQKKQDTKQKIKQLMINKQ